MFSDVAQRPSMFSGVSLSVVTQRLGKFSGAAQRPSVFSGGGQPERSGDYRDYVYGSQLANEMSAESRYGNNRDYEGSGISVAFCNEHNVRNSHFDEFDSQYVNDSLYTPTCVSQQSNYLKGNVFDDKADEIDQTGKMISDLTSKQSCHKLLLQEHRCADVSQTSKEYRRAKSLSAVDRGKARTHQQNSVQQSVKNSIENHVVEKSPVTNMKSAGQIVYSVPSSMCVDMSQGTRPASVSRQIDDELESLHDEVNSKLNQIESEIERLRGVSSPEHVSERSPRRSPVCDMSAVTVQRSTGDRSPEVELSNGSPSRPTSRSSVVAENVASMIDREVTATLLDMVAQRQCENDQNSGRQTPEMSMTINAARAPVLESSSAVQHQHDGNQDTGRRTPEMSMSINAARVPVLSTAVVDNAVSELHQVSPRQRPASRASFARTQPAVNYRVIDEDIEMRTDICSPDRDNDNIHDDIGDVRRLSEVVEQRQLSEAVPSQPSSSQKRRSRSGSQSRHSRNDRADRREEPIIVSDDRDESSHSSRRKCSTRSESPKSK